MAATTIRELLVRLGVSDTTASVAGVTKLDESLTSLVEVGAKAVAAVTAVAVGLATLAISASSAGDAIDKGAQGAAISTDAYQELAFAASQSGTSIETVAKALGKQTVALQQMADGAGPAADALEELGLGYEELAALTPDQQLQATAEALSQVSDEQQRLSLATAIYGEEMAQQLLPLLSLGGEGIQQLRDQAHDLGMVLSEEGVASAVLFTDSLDQLLGLLGGVKNAIGLALLPTLSDLIIRIRDWYTANSQVIQQRVAEWAAVVVAGLESMVRMFDVLDDVVQRVFGGWEPILAGAALLVAALTAAVATLAGLKAWFAIEAAIAAIGAIGLATFGQIVAGVLAAAAVIAGLVLVVDDLITYFRGGQSALGDFLDSFRDAEGILGATARTIEKLIAIGGVLFDIVQQIGAIWYAVFEVTALPIIQALGAALLYLAEAGLGAIAWWADTVVLPALDLVLQALSAVSSGIGSVAGVLGIDVGSATAIPTTAGPAFAPDTAGALSAATAGSSSTSVQVQGSTYSITGVGMSMEEVEAFIESQQAAQNAQTAAALAGAEV